MAVIWLTTAIQSQSITENAFGSPIGEQLLLYPPQLTPLAVVGNMFMHLSITHLLMNLIMLLLLGREIETATNPWLYGAIFLAGGLGADAAVVHFDAHSATAGASGALYALMVLFVGVAYRRKTDLRAPLVLIAVNLVYTLIIPGISFWGHLGGLFAGVFLLPTVLSNRLWIRLFSLTLVIPACLYLTFY
ncbi:MAG: rhomboid family intramembrane serine protease [Corynebacterium sp.]|nr:rhomboid family intramembrane serine protease [Corynebacterium sp.]